MGTVKPYQKFLIAIGLLFTLAVIVDNSSDSVDLPFIPDLTINGMEIPELQGAQLLSNTEVSAILRREFSGIRDFNLADRHYQALNHQSFVEFASFMNRVYWQTPTLKYRPESYDCDNFARTAVVLADLANPTGFVGQITLFRIYVHQDHPFGGVPAGGNHALIAFISDRGVFIYEPQSGRIEPISQYPNRAFRLTAD